MDRTLAHSVVSMCLRGCSSDNGVVKELIGLWGVRGVVMVVVLLLR